MSTIASREAYQQQIPQMSAKRAAVWAVVRACHGAGVTIREAMILTNWGHSTVSARLYELAEAGLIKEIGQQRQGQTVWVPAEAGEVEALRAARAAAKKARKSPRVKRLEKALGEALARIEAEGLRFDEGRAVLEDKPWPPPAGA